MSERLQSTTGEREYVLGTHGAELERLRFQHQAWVAHAHRVWARAGIGAGQAVLDLGCGPGFTALELALLVGPRGRVVGRDQSARFLEHLRAEAARQGLAQVETSLGPAEELDVGEAALDAVYSRWLLCWLPEPELAVRRVARALRPGGVLVAQEYLDWATMDLMPPSDVQRRSVDACMQGWRASGGDIDVGKRLPALAEAAGLRVESCVPVARIGRPGSLEWRWVGGFLDSWLPKLVERGLLDAAHVEAHRREWARYETLPGAALIAPTMLDLIARKP